MPEPVLHLDQVSRTFPVRSKLLRRRVGVVHAVDNVSLSVLPGETVGLVGESGSGKSTLGRLAVRLIAPTKGRVLLDGMDLATLSGADLRRERRSIQMVFQDPYSSLDPHATIGDSIAEPLQLHRELSRPEREMRVAELLERVHLSPTYVHRYPHEFSGGQLQRIALARALALSPKVIVADEPVSSLDVSTQAQVLRLLRQVQDDTGISYLFISHDLSVVNYISQRVAVMYLGRIVEVGATDAVIHHPQHPYTEALLSAVPKPDPANRTRERIVLIGDPPSPVCPPAGCGFHTRCPRVMDICRTVDPPGVVAANGTQVWCHLRTPLDVCSGEPAIRQGVNSLSSHEFSILHGRLSTTTNGPEILPSHGR